MMAKKLPTIAHKRQILSPIALWARAHRKIFETLDFQKSVLARNIAAGMEHTFLKRTQNAPKSSLRALQNEKLRCVLETAVHLPFWKNAGSESFLQKEGLPLEKIKKFPVSTKGDIQRHFPDGLVNRDLPRRRYYKEHTSGSTGAQLGFFEDTTTIPGRIARYRRQRSWIEGAPHSSLMRIMNRERLGFSREGACLTKRANEALDEALLGMYRVLERESRNKPVFLESISSYLLRLAQLIREKELKKINVSGLLTFGEVLAPSEKKFIEETFSSKIFSRYSLREFSTVAQGCGRAPGGALHIIAEHFFVEILDEDGKDTLAGENGKIVVTSLENTVMPFIRYDTGDRGRILGKPCPCGRTLPLVLFEGRSGVSGGADGKIEAIKMLSEKFYEKGQFQIVYDEKGAVDVLLHLFERYQNEKMLRITEHALRKALGDGAGVKVRFVPFIPLSDGGKRVLVKKRTQ